MSNYYHPKPLSLMAHQAMDAAKIQAVSPVVRRSSAIASLKASLALNIKDKPILGYDAAVYHQVAAEEADREYWHKLTGGESDNWPPCKQEGDV